MITNLTWRLHSDENAIIESASLILPDDNKIELTDWNGKTISSEYTSYGYKDWTYFNYELNTDLLNEGENNIGLSISVKDSAGNATTAELNDYIVTKDTTPPQVDIAITKVESGDTVAMWKNTQQYIKDLGLEGSDLDKNMSQHQSIMVIKTVSDAEHNEYGVSIIAKDEPYNYTTGKDLKIQINGITLSAVLEHKNMVSLFDGDNTVTVTGYVYDFVGNETYINYTGVITYTPENY